eukprot:200338_1
MVCLFFFFFLSEVLKKKTLMIKVQTGNKRARHSLCAVIILVFIISIVMIFLANPPIELKDLIYTDFENTESLKFNNICSKWNCSVLNHINNETKSFCWDDLPQMRLGYQFIGIPGINLSTNNINPNFTIYCSSIISQIINFTDQPLILNTFFMDGIVSDFKIGGKIIPLKRFYQSRGFWYMSKPFIYEGGKNISFIFSTSKTKYNRWPLCRISFVPIAASENNNYDISIWSILPYMMKQYKCENLTQLWFGGLKDWSPCLDQFKLSNSH